MTKKPLDQAAVDAAIAGLEGALIKTREIKARMRAVKERIRAALAEIDNEYEKCQAEAVVGHISPEELAACRKARALAYKQVRELLAEEAV